MSISVKLKDVKVGDVVRRTLGCEWTEVAEITRPTPKWVTLKTAEGTMISNGHEGKTIWVNQNKS